MDSKNVRKYIKFGAKLLALAGVRTLTRGLMPYEAGMLTKVSCELGSIFIVMAMEPVINDQVLICEKFIDELIDGNGTIIAA